MVFLVLFNNIFKALNLFLNRYLAEIQQPDNGISHLAAVRIPQMFCTQSIGKAWHWWLTSHHTIAQQLQLQLCSMLAAKRFAQTLGTANTISISATT